MIDSVSIKIENIKPLNKIIDDLAKQYPKEAQRAVNKTAQRSATRTRRDLAKAVGLPQKEIKKRVKYFKAGKGRKSASVWVGTKSGIPLGRVGGARSSLSGVLKAGRNKVQTFRAKMPSGYIGQFVRKPGAKHKTRPDGERTQLPIEEPRIRLAGPARPIIMAVARHQMAEFFPVELKRLVKRATDRATLKRSKGKR